MQEGQPRLIQKIIHPFRHGEGRARRETRTQTPQIAQPRDQQRVPVLLSHDQAMAELEISMQKTQAKLEAHRQAWETNPLLTQEDKDWLKADGERAKRGAEELQVRLANEPKAEGSILPLVLEYMLLLKRLEPQAKAQGVSVQSLMPPEWQTKPMQKTQEAPLTPEQRRGRATETVRTQQAELKKEVESAEFDRIAQSIQQDIWKDTSKTSPVSVRKPVAKDAVKIGKDYQEIKNNSFAGVTLSYKYDDATDSLVRKVKGKEEKPDSYTTIENTLIMGVRYVTTRDDLIPEAQAFVSDEDLQQSIRVYYVQRTYVELKDQVVYTGSGFETIVERKRVTKTVAVPVHLQNAKREFVKHLLDASQELSPQQVREKRMKQKYSEPTQAAA